MEDKKHLVRIIPIHSDDAMFSKPDSLDSRLRGNDGTQLITGVHGAVRMKWYMAFLGATWEAAAVAGIDVVGLAAVFVYSRLNRRGQEHQSADADDYIDIDTDL